MTTAGSFLALQQATFLAPQASPEHHMQPARGSALQLWSRPDCPLFGDEDGEWGQGEHSTAHPQQCLQQMMQSTPH